MQSDSSHTASGSGQKVISDFQAVSLASESPVDELELFLCADFGVAAILTRANAYLNAKLNALFVVFKIQKRAGMRSQDVCSNQNLKWKIRHDTELVPDESQVEGDEQYCKAREFEGSAFPPITRTFPRSQIGGL